MRKFTKEEAEKLWCPETLDKPKGPDVCMGTDCVAFDEAGTEIRWSDLLNMGEEAQMYTCRKCFP